MGESALLVWAEQRQLPLVLRTTARASRPVAVAGSPLPGESGGIASALGCERITDLRAALESVPPGTTILLAAREPITADARQVILRRRLPAVSLEPCPGRFMDLRESPSDALAAPHAPRFSRVGDGTTLSTVLADFGAATAIQVSMSAPAISGSGRARLFDALDLITAWLGEPETIDASILPITTTPTESDTAWSTDDEVMILAHARLAGSRAASIAVRIGGHLAWTRRVRLHGPGGTLEVTDRGYRRSTPTGDVLESGPEPEARVAPDGDAWGPAECLASALAQHGAPVHEGVPDRVPSAAPGRSVIAPPTPERERRLHAALEACRVSALTRCAESVDRFLQMLA